MGPKGNSDAEFVITRTPRNPRKISEMASTRSTLRWQVCRRITGLPVGISW